MWGEGMLSCLKNIFLACHGGEPWKFTCLTRWLFFHFNCFELSLRAYVSIPAETVPFGNPVGTQFIGF